MSVGDRIKQVRKNIGLSQREFGKRVGLTDGAISLIETGLRNLSDVAMKSICREYGVNLDYLLYGNEPMFAPKETTALDKIEQWLTGDNEFVKSVFIEEANLSPEKWAVVQEFMEGVVSRMLQNKKAGE